MCPSPAGALPHASSLKGQDEDHSLGGHALSVQNTLWLQKQVISQGPGQGQQGDEVKAVLARQSANGTAAEVLQAAWGVGQGEERPVERLVHLQRKAAERKWAQGTHRHAPPPGHQGKSVPLCLTRYVQPGAGLSSRERKLCFYNAVPAQSGDVVLSNLQAALSNLFLPSPLGIAALQLQRWLRVRPVLASGGLQSPGHSISAGEHQVLPGVH